MPVTRADAERWLREDLGHDDVTNDLPGTARARLVAKEDGVVAGLGAASAVFDVLGTPVELRVEPGERVDAGDVILAVEDATRTVLRGERVATNLVGHASGIATRTRAAVDAACEVNEDTAIAATRKTTPGLRGVEKRAVRVGGGDTHRLDASHMVMVKDNHIAAYGLEDAVERFQERASFATRIDAEVETVNEAARAADAGADIVLVDNAPPETVGEARECLDSSVVVEASGGIGVADVPDYAAAGADVVSMGALTHSAPPLDCSFRLLE
ncbi:MULTISPECIES: carboxylating nicotinate-nucleotide diphosphorylase [Halobacterium]|uniref:carboxylating nicotinate-nucleotide diphosphorylase n=1 Tax=Halobacterium TaxID=2239 RepID=UPI00073F0542|nr:carboxylating nicotinate-nucleotide diphosphorylase [Halobacterium sp. CBA1132]MCG1002976.1 carboxylating nicotinate-nucleotide diphosphorylase [Halobacterium noricense]